MNDDLAMLTALGGVRPDPKTVAAALERASRDASPPERLFGLLNRAKVTRLARAAIGGDAPNRWAGELLDRLDAEVKEDDDWRALAVPKMRAVVAATAARGGRIIKGLAVQSLYPEPELRHIGDVDVHYPTWRSALPLLRELRADGWVYDVAEYPWLKWHESGPPYGQLSLVFPDNEAPYARVDLHIGAYSVGHAGLLPLTGWRDGAAMRVAVEVPNLETSIALIAAHAVCDQMLSMKDVNDIHVLLAGAVPDWVSTIEACRAVGADSMLCALLDATRRAYPDDPIPDLRPLGPASSPIGVEPPDVAERARRFAALAYRDERARGVDHETAVQVSREAEGYFSADLMPRSSEGPQEVPSRGRRGRGRCWRLIPEETWAGLPAAAYNGGATTTEELAEELVLVRNGTAAAIVSGGDVFVPTVWGDINPKSVALARSVAGETR